MQSFTYSYYTLRREENHTKGRQAEKNRPGRKVRGGSAGYSGFIP